MIPGVPRAGHQPGVGAHTALKVIETKLESGALRISQALCVRVCVRPSTTNVGVNGVLSDFAISRIEQLQKPVAITIGVDIDAPRTFCPYFKCLSEVETFDIRFKIAQSIDLHCPQNCWQR